MSSTTISCAPRRRFSSTLSSTLSRMRLRACSPMWEVMLAAGLPRVLEHVQVPDGRLVLGAEDVVQARKGVIHHQRGHRGHALVRERGDQDLVGVDPVEEIGLHQEVGDLVAEAMRPSLVAVLEEAVAPSGKARPLVAWIRTSSAYVSR